MLLAPSVVQEKGKKEGNEARSSREGGVLLAPSLPPSANPSVVLDIHIHFNGNLRGGGNARRSKELPTVLLIGEELRCK